MFLARAKRYSTGYSRVVTQRSTNPAQSSLPAVIGRERGYSGWYDRSMFSMPFSAYLYLQCRARYMHYMHLGVMEEDASARAGVQLLLLCTAVHTCQLQTVTISHKCCSCCGPQGVVATAAALSQPGADAAAPIAVVNALLLSFKLWSAYCTFMLLLLPLLLPVMQPDPSNPHWVHHAMRHVPHTDPLGTPCTSAPAAACMESR